MRDAHVGSRWGSRAGPRLVVDVAGARRKGSRGPPCPGLVEPPPPAFCSFLAGFNCLFCFLLFFRVIYLFIYFFIWFGFGFGVRCSLNRIYGEDRIDLLEAASPRYDVPCLSCCGSCFQWRRVGRRWRESINDAVERVDTSAISSCVSPSLDRSAAEQPIS